MRRLFPEVYWNPTGKKGIIDTGKTIEFWLKPCGYNGLQEIVNEAQFHIMYRDTRFKDYPVFSAHTHTIGLMADANYNGVGVALTIRNDLVKTFFKEQAPYVMQNKDTTTLIIGQVPSNSNIHKIIAKKIGSIKPGRLIKLQMNPELNMKVRLPYGIYTYNSDDEIIIDHKQKMDNRFRDLVFDEDK